MKTDYLKKKKTKINPTVFQGYLCHSPTDYFRKLQPRQPIKIL